MARFEFGGVFAAWIVSSVNGDVTSAGTVVAEATDILTLPVVEDQLEIFDAPDGAGTLVVDFLDEAGLPVSAISVAAGDPYIPRFSGPDGVGSLWVQAASGRWLPLPRFDDGTALDGGGGGGTGDVQLAGDNAFEYADSQSPPWLVLKRPNDSSDSSLWANMLEFQYWDDTTSSYRLGAYVNEKGLLRTRGVTPIDVPARFMAHPAQDVSVPVFEVAKSDNTIKLFQVFESKAVAPVGMQLPFIVNPAGERLYFGSADPATDAAYADFRPQFGDAWLDYNGSA